MLRASARYPRHEPSQRNARWWRGAECLRPSNSPARPTSGRTTGRSNLSLANALDCRSDPSCISRNREAVTGRTKPDQSMKSSTNASKTSRRRLSASLCASSSSPSPSLPSSPCCPPSRVVGDFEVHDSLMHCVCMYYNAMKKTLSRLKEALTRVDKSSEAPRDAVNFLSSIANYFAPRGISSPILRECKKPL